MDYLSLAGLFVIIVICACVSVYLWWTKDRRKLPRFVMKQLISLNFLFIFAIIIQVYLTYHDFVKKSTNQHYTDRESLYRKITYPLQSLINVFFLQVNWEYVNCYFKAALLLPIILDQDKIQVDEARKQITLRQKLIKVTNYVWLAMCCLSVILSTIATFLWNEDEEVQGFLVKNGMTCTLTTFFVVAFCCSMLMIKKALSRQQAIEACIDFKSISIQLVVYLTYYFCYVIRLIFTTYEQVSQKNDVDDQSPVESCEATFYSLVFSIPWLVSMFFVVAIILRMTVKYTETADHSKSKLFFQQASND